MTWALYTTLTARNRAIEAVVALFALLWAVIVFYYAVIGTEPLTWAGMAHDAQWHIPGAMLIFCAAHMIGTATTRAAPLPAVLRAIGMAGMAATFSYLTYQGVGSSAAPTYSFITVCCAAGVFNAIRDARYAVEVARAC